MLVILLVKLWIVAVHHVIEAIHGTISRRRGSRRIVGSAVRILVLGWVLFDDRALRRISIRTARARARNRTRTLVIRLLMGIRQLQPLNGRWRAVEADHVRELGLEMRARLRVSVLVRECVRTRLLRGGVLMVRRFVCVICVEAHGERAGPGTRVRRDRFRAVRMIRGVPRCSIRMVAPRGRTVVPRVVSPRGCGSRGR